MPHREWKNDGLPTLVRKLVKTYDDGTGVNQIEGHDLPNREAVRASLDRLFAILYPGLVDEHPVTQANLVYHIGDLVNHVYLDLTPEVERAFRYDCRQGRCDKCHVERLAHEAVIHLLESLPRLRETVKQDLQAAFERDPAARSVDEIVLAYPCVEAIATARLAHELYAKGVPLIPRMWSERAHSRTGIDIHPGAAIGPRFFIDHGTGVVIGETCVIGRSVTIYQGVTLGALAPAKGQSLAGKRRHPTLEDEVTIYAGATILGGETTIGKGAVVGGNVWLTSSVAPGTKVLIAKTDLVFLQPGKKPDAKPIDKAEFQCPAKPLCQADGTIKKDP